MDVPEGWVPEFPGQRPPFMPGNQWRAELGNDKAVTHGVYSDVRVEALAKQIVKRLRATEGLDYLSAPRFTGPLWDYARARARSNMYHEWCDALPIEQQTQAERGVTPPLEKARQLSVRAAGLGARIGLQPVITDEVADEIAAARTTIAKRAEAKQLQADLRDAIAADWDRRRS